MYRASLASSWMAVNVLIQYAVAMGSVCTSSGPSILAQAFRAPAAGWSYEAARSCCTELASFGSSLARTLRRASKAPLMAPITALRSRSGS